MRKVYIDYVLSGMKLAKAVFSPEGRVLLASGVELSDLYIEKLKKMDITELYIEDEISEGVEIKDVVCEQTRLEAKHLIKDMMNNFSLRNTIDSDKVKQVVDRIIDELLYNKDIVVNLSDIKSVDDYTFEHSVNVCVLSTIIGIGLGYNMLRLKDLAVGAILHDIGKLKIPESILKKPGQLTSEEFEEIQKHTLYGYEILKNNDNISTTSAFIAFGHHERYDGSGYPIQLKGENIHQFARVVAVADVYDALTSDRVYRKKLRPHEVIEYITSLGTHHFDKEIVDCFINHIALYPVGTGVILNTKQKALVIECRKNMPTRPVVRIIYDENGNKLANYQEVDLSMQPNMFVVDACEI